MSVLDDLVDCFRNLIPYCVVLIVPLLILISPIDPVKAAQQFTAYRLQQFDIQGLKIGSRSSAFNFEAQTSSSKQLSRKCLLLKIMEVSVAAIKLAISQNVGSIIILLPVRSQWDSAIREHILNLEREFLVDEFPIPIYVAFETEEVEQIYENVRQLMESSRSASAAEAMLRSVMSNGYQLYTAQVQGRPLTEFQIVNLFGKLAGHGIEEQLPTLLIVAHYDSMGMAPSLSHGFESNASGVVALLQLMRLMARLFSVQRTQPRFNVAFLLAGGGKLNYIGTKKWLDEISDLHDGSLNADRVALVLCLERLIGTVQLESGASRNRHQGSPIELVAHVSRVPRPGSIGERLAAALDVAARVAHGGTARVLHRRINLSEQQLRWHHERFSLKKLPAMTLSAGPGDATDSILDRYDQDGDSRSTNQSAVAMEMLARNTRVVADAVARVLFNLDQSSIDQSDAQLHSNRETRDHGDQQNQQSPNGDDESFVNNVTMATDTASQLQPEESSSSVSSSSSIDIDQELIIGSDWVSEEAMRADMSLLCLFARSQQLLDHRHPLVVSLERLFKRYLQNARVVKATADPRDPEFVLYGDTEATIVAHRVKPALFDFLIACAVVCYLGLVFLFVEHFSWVCRVVLRVSLAAPDNNNNSNHHSNKHKEKLV